MKSDTMLLFLMCAPLRFASSANILIAYDLPSPSHQIWNYVLAEGLMERGHNVTMLGPFTDKGKKSERYHPLVTEGLLEEMGKHEEFAFDSGKWTQNVLVGMTVLMKYAWIACNHSYQTKGFHSLLAYPKDFKFDLIILDVTVSSCFYPLIQRFYYPPTIAVTAFLLPSFLSDVFGNAIQPAYLPFIHSEYTEDMSFFQRLWNYIYMRLELLGKDIYELKEIGKMARRTFGNDVASMDSLQRHISILMCNINPAINSPRPLTPNIIPVGGLHVREARQLPKDLQAVMDNADHGVILLCLGTNINFDKLNQNLIQALLQAFAKLNQTVVWKFESKLDNLPKNVLIRSWLPQNDILGHPNTKLFISHGGALSTFEAIYHGVPIIGMPFIVDQRITVNSMAEKKTALKLDYLTVTSDEVFEKVQEILSNSMYTKRMKELSRRMRDQPQTPLERAVFWAEYAIRHNGAQFLNPKSRDMSLIVSTSTDVILFLILVAVSFFCALLVACNKISHHLKSKETKKEKLN